MAIDDHYHFNWLSSPRTKIIFIEVLVLVGAFLLIFMLLLGSVRRRSSSVFVMLPIWAVYTLSYSFVSYTIGLMHGSTSGNELYVVWAIGLVMLLGTADSISAFSLEDNNNWKRYYTQQLLQFFWVGWLWGNYSASMFKYPVIFLYILCSLRTFQLILSFQWVSKSHGLKKSIKLVADYMNYEHQSEAEVHPVHMRGYNYLVIGEDKQEARAKSPDYLFRVQLTEDVITIDKIWRCEGRLLRKKEDKLKDICLSYALAKLLCRRFFNYALAESGLPKTRDLVFRGLLSQDDNPERVFRVIEVELAFIYDFFYTKYPLIFNSYHIPKILSLFSACPMIWIAVELFKHYRNPNGDLTLIPGHKRNYDALVTFFLVVIIVCFEYLQIFLYMVSDWAKVSYICNYVSKPSCQGNLLMERAITLLGGIRIFKHWQNNISQYSFLNSFQHNPRRNFFACLTCDLIDKRRRGQKQGGAISLSIAVKKAVLHSLRINDGKLSNGMFSLLRSGVGELSWACQLETHTHSILVWHIATTLCQEKSSNERKKDQGKDQNLGAYFRRIITAALCKNKRSKDVNEDKGDNYEIATGLSNYCAYLVAFAAQFLPDHSSATEIIFDEVVKEARTSLDGWGSMSQRCRTMMNTGEPSHDDTILVKGAKLGKQLIEKIEDERQRWKVLADYWAEMMLFVAPSENATAHLQKLAEGGEFVTHLWALLTHAGILQREPQPPTV